jgi:hypothetical protein
MTVRDPYLCQTCNRAMVLRRSIPSRDGQPDITVWGCVDCSERQEAAIAANVARHIPATKRLPSDHLT